MYIFDLNSGGVIAMELSCEIKDRVNKLRSDLTYHAQQYYVYDNPEISDYEYDMMYAELKALEEKYPELYDPASPTQRVGGKPLDKFEKVVHTARMDSLSDVFSFEETASAVGEISKLDSVEIKGLMAMLPISSDSDYLASLCKKMRSLYDDLKNDGYPFEYLSMGTSGDYNIAINNGSNTIRLGRNIFGERNYGGK